VTTHTDDALGLLRACALFPDDDTPRMMYADYLDGLDPVWATCPKCKGIGDQGPGSGVGYNCPECRGAGTVRDAANSARAELIRVQCELARLPETVVAVCNRCGRKENRRSWSVQSRCGKCQGSMRRPDGSKTPHNTRDLRCPQQALRIRADALLRDHAARWRAVGMCPTCGGKGKRIRQGDTQTAMSNECPDCSGTGGTGGLLRKVENDVSPREGEYLHEAHFRRGFVERIDCALSDVCERACKECGTTRWGRGDGCVYCDGGTGNRIEWRPTALARAWLTAAPERALVRELWATDKEPWDFRRDGALLPDHAGKPHIWLSPDDDLHPQEDTAASQLPAPLFKAVVKANGGFNGWESPDAACVALARGLCAWARG
jgi:hypothetical protein